jgi:hypothetical protein
MPGPAADRTLTICQWTTGPLSGFVESEASNYRKVLSLDNRRIEQPLPGR